MRGRGRGGEAGDTGESEDEMKGKEMKIGIKTKSRENEKLY